MKLFRRPTSRYWFVDLRRYGHGKPSTGCEDYQEAEQWAAAYLLKIGAPIERGEPTALSRLAERYLAFLEPRSGVQTYARAQTAIRSFRSWWSGDPLIATITTDQIEAYQAHRAQSVEASTVNRDFNVLRVLFKKAIAWKILAASPCTGVADLAEHETLPKSYSEEDIERLLTASPPHLRRLWLLFLNTGLRRGELLRLRWSDIKEGMITVLDSKGKAEKRIPVSAELGKVLADWPREDRIFSGLCGDSLSRSFRRCAEQAGVGGNLHRLRHSFATHLLEKGVPLPFVQQLLHHADIRMTSQYTKGRAKHLKEAVDKLSFVPPVSQPDSSNRASD